MNKYLEVEGLYNDINGFALEDISFIINEGEIVLLGGINSSGKTSLLETLSLVRKPIDGKIALFENEVFDGGLKKKSMKKVKSLIGVQFQGDDLFNNLTVKETFELFSKGYGSIDIFKFMEGCPYLKGALDKRIFELSEGKKQLVRFMLSIIHDPKMVFLDEPVSNLDLDTRAWVYRKIKKMRSTGTSFLITLNDMWRIGDISNRLMVLSDGRLHQVVDDFSDYHKGCIVKIPIESFDSLKDEAWVLRTERKEDHYDVYSKLSMSAMRDRAGFPYLEIRKAGLKDFLPEVKG